MHHRPLILCALPATLLLVAAPATADSTRKLAATAELKRTARPSANQTIQRGPIRGIPLGRGTMTLNSKLTGGYVNSTFTVTTARGVVRGRSRARLTLDGDTASYKGTATLISGTRLYKGIKGIGITVSGEGPVSAKETTIRLRGKVRY